MLFRSVESVVSAATIVLVVRTRGPIWTSSPSRPLVVATAVVVISAIGLPFTPLGRLFGFEALPAEFLLCLAAILVLYILSAETAKRWFYRRQLRPAACAGPKQTTPPTPPGQRP